MNFSMDFHYEGLLAAGLPSPCIFSAKMYKTRKQIDDSYIAAKITSACRIRAAQIIPLRSYESKEKFSGVVTYIKYRSFAPHISQRSLRLSTAKMNEFHDSFINIAAENQYVPIFLREIKHMSSVLAYWLDYETYMLYYGFCTITMDIFSNSISFTLITDLREPNINPKKPYILEGFAPYQDWKTIDPYVIRIICHRGILVSIPKYSQMTRLIGVAVPKQTYRKWIT